MTPLESMAQAYWNAFRDGFVRVGGDPREYPLWTQSNDEVKTETLRCLRHAVETLKLEWDTGPRSFDHMFPEPLAKRSIKRSANDDEMAERAR